MFWLHHRLSVMDASRRQLVAVSPIDPITNHPTFDDVMKIATDMEADMVDTRPVPTAAVVDRSVPVVVDIESPLAPLIEEDEYLEKSHRSRANSSPLLSFHEEDIDSFSDSSFSSFSTHDENVSLND
jgi:hypothetical protein